jgi:pentatricopeptide repeat protein
MSSQEQLMQYSYNSKEGAFLEGSLLDILVSVRLELIAFCTAVLMYSVLFTRRIAVVRSPKKTSKLDISQEGTKQSLTTVDHPSAMSSPRIEKSIAPKPDIAKQIAGSIVKIRKYASENNLKGAMDVFEALETCGAELNNIVYNTVLDACVKCKDLTAAQAWMKKSKEAGMIDVISFNTLLKGYLMTGDVAGARSVVREMRLAGYQPNRVTFNELVNAVVARNGPLSEIWDIVTEMQALGIPPNQVTCSILLKNLSARSSESEIQRTMDLISSIDGQMDDVLMSSVVEACVRVGKPDLLTTQLQKLKEHSRLPVNSSHTFGSLIKAYGYAQDINAVWRCWQEMRSQLIKPSCITLGCIVEALVTNRCTEDAYDLVQQLQSDPLCQDIVNSITYCSLLKGFSREKRLPRVWNVYEDIEERKLELSLVAFNTVLDACARVGRMDHVPKIMDAMKKHAVQANIITYSTLVKGHCQAGNIELGFAVLSDMKRDTQLKPDEILYNSMLDGCAQHGLYEEGLRLFDEMVSEGVAPSNFTLSILVKLMSRSHKVDQAFAIVSDVSQKYRIKPNLHVYTNLIQACVSNRRHHARALSVLETMVKERVKPDCRTYGILIRASIFQNLYDQAAGLLRGAMGLPGALEVLADVRFAACSPLDSGLVNTTLSSLAEHGCTETLVKPILEDLQNSKCRVRIDASVQNLATSLGTAPISGKAPSKGNGRAINAS